LASALTATLLLNLLKLSEICAPSRQLATATLHYFSPHPKEADDKLPPADCPARAAAWAEQRPCDQRGRDHSMSRLADSCSFQRSMTAFARMLQHRQPAWH
jgi:hypothetical protein